MWRPAISPEEFFIPRNFRMANSLAITTSENSSLTNMAKTQDSKKETKKAPTKTAKEKKEAKREKKAKTQSK
jgi:hypothetical protein